MVELGTINNKGQRNDRGKCLGWPVTSYGARKKVVQISVLLFVKLSLKILYSVLIKQQQKIITANCILYVLATNCICSNSN